MNIKNITRRRGTSIAAAALSLALVAPVVQPVAFAQDAPAAEAYKDAIVSPGNPTNSGTISGSVKQALEAAVGFGNVQDSGKALEGVTVYAQWYEGEKTQHASPIYKTTSDANGNFSLDMAPYVDAAGVRRTFVADASVGLTTGPAEGQRDQRREKIRVWAELPENLVSDYRLMHQPAAGIFPLTTTTPGTQGDGVWADGKVSGVHIQYVQKNKLPQHLPAEKQVESNGSGLYGSYQGRVFWNLDVLQGALNHNVLILKKDPKDVNAAGMKVVGSYLNDEAVKAIHDHVASNYAGKKLRGDDWTIEDEQSLQQWINEQVAKDPEGWIAETVKTTTDANGQFQLYWKGIYGQAWDRKGTVPEDKFHKLAESRDEGTFVNGNHNSKHVNMDWSYVQILDQNGEELPENVGLLYPWALGRWAGPSAAGGKANLFGGDGAEINYSDDKYLRFNSALYPAPLKFDVLEKNTYDNWARIGEKVETEASGLPIGEGLEYFIEWTNGAGDVVDTCGPVLPDEGTRIPSCPLTVPADAEHGEVFTARLYEGEDNSGLLLAQDAFAVTTAYLGYEPTDAKVDEPAVAEPIYDNPNTEAVEPKLDSAKFYLDESNLPDGVTADQVEVDEATGKVTFTPKAGQEGKTFDIPVRMVDEKLQVPELDENGDPVLDDQGQPKTKPRTIAHSVAEFKVAGPETAATIEPKYEDQLVVPGEETKSTPTFTDKDGKDAKAPEGSKFEITDGFTAPEGYEVKIDENTGEITVTVDGDKLNKDTVEEFDVPVTVTYPDGSTDKTDANFKLDTDGDGTPDTEDGDDDNDGIPDEDDSNPKVPNANDHYEPGYEDGSGKPGEDVTVDAPEFTDKDGNKTEAPEDTTFKPGEGAPEGVKVDENTGEITVPVPEDAKPGDEIKVPVVVTYPDGTTDNVDVTVTVDEPDAKTADEIEPDYKDGSGKPGEDVTVDKPVFKDKDGKETTPPEGTKFEKGEGAPEDVTVNEDGSITVPVPEGAKPGDEIKVPVVVTYPDGSTDEVEVTVTVTEKDKNPDWDDTTTTPGTEVTIPNTGGPVEDGTTVEVEGPGKAELDEDGNIVVTPNDDAKPGDKITVVVKDKDGNEIDRVEVEIKDQTPPTVDPVKEGDKEISGKGDRPGETIIVTLPDGTEIETTTDEDGNWTVEVPEDKPLKPGDKINVRDEAGNKADTVTVGRAGSSEREGCTESLIGFGLPLLALIPLGIASQTAIPGLQNIQAQVGRQIQDANSALQNQLGIMDPRLAKAAADFQAQLKGAGANLSQVLGGIAVLAYGIAAITTIATKCGPGNTKLKTEGNSSSIFGQGSSFKSETGKGSSIRNDENKDLSSKEEGDKGSSAGQDEGKEGSSLKGSSDKDNSDAEADAPAEDAPAEDAAQ